METILHENSEEGMDREGSTEEAGDSDDPDREYEVDLILNHCDGYYTNGERAFLVAWKGFGPKDNSWEPESSLLGNCQESLDYYWKINAPSIVRRCSQRRREERIQTYREMTVDDVIRNANEAQRMRIFRTIGRDRLHLARFDRRVKEIAHVRSTDEGHMIGVIFDDGFRFEYTYEAMRERCPLLLLDFLLGKYGGTASIENAAHTASTNNDSGAAGASDN